MVVWNTGLAAERARDNLKLKKALKEGAYKRWKKLLKKKRQDYINGERLQHLLGWKGSSDFGPKPQAASAKPQASSATKKTQS